MTAKHDLLRALQAEVNRALREQQRKSPTFEEGPFFHISVPIVGQPDRGFIVWATDAHTARDVFSTKTKHPTAYIHLKLVGSLSDLKRDYKLTPTQIADLHREGYLRL